MREIKYKVKLSTKYGKQSPTELCTFYFLAANCNSIKKELRKTERLMKLGKRTNAFRVAS